MLFANIALYEHKEILIFFLHLFGGKMEIPVFKKTNTGVHKNVHTYV